MNVLPFISYAVAIAGFLAGGIGVFKAKDKDATIGTLAKKSLVDEGYIKSLESENIRLKGDRDSYKRRYEDAKEMAQGSPQLIILTKAIERQTEALKKIFDIKSVLEPGDTKK